MLCVPNSCPTYRFNTINVYATKFFDFTAYKIINHHSSYIISTEFTTVYYNYNYIVDTNILYRHSRVVIIIETNVPAIKYFTR